MYCVAAITWQQNRREWIGDRSQRSKGLPKDPVIRYKLWVTASLSPIEFCCLSFNCGQLLHRVFLKKSFSLYRQLIGRMESFDCLDKLDSVRNWRSRDCIICRTNFLRLCLDQEFGEGKENGNGKGR